MTQNGIEYPQLSLAIMGAGSSTELGEGTESNCLAILVKFNAASSQSAFCKALHVFERAIREDELRLELSVGT